MFSVRGEEMFFSGVGVDNGRHRVDFLYLCERQQALKKWGTAPPTIDIGERGLDPVVPTETMELRDDCFMLWIDPITLRAGHGR